MFLEFSVENFRSIADRQTLSFVAGKHKSEATGTPAVEEPGFTGGPVLSTAVVYGANASGKSNLLLALNRMIGYVGRSATPGTMSVNPFRLDAAWASKPTRFELSFMKEGIRYQYGFALDAERVHEEWLIAYPKKTPQVWFHRGKDAGKKDMHFGSHLRGEKLRIAAMTRPDALFLSVATQFNHAQISEIHQWLRRHVVAQPSQSFGPVATARLIHMDSSKQEVVGRWLQGADLRIAGVTVRRHAEKPDASSGAKAVIRTDKDDEFFEILTEHRRTDGSIVAFDLSMDESEGTARYFELLAPLMHALARGGLLAIDELDQSLHPLLVRSLVSLFHDPKSNPHHAQLVFNTHDTTLLDPKLFRRDQIWFMEKDADGKSRLYSLLDYSPRKDEALQRGYLQGRYGAIPFLGGLDFAAATAERS